MKKKNYRSFEDTRKFVRKLGLKNEEECLAACTGAPMMMLDHHYIENLDIKTVDQILDDLEKNND